MAKREFNRAQRLGDQIHRELAVLIESEIGDPRVRSVTLTAVKLSRDLGHARVYFTTLDDGDGRKQAEQGLSSAATFLRRQLSDRIIARIMPRLSFVYDESVERGRHMEDLIRKAVADDKGPDADD